MEAKHVDKWHWKPGPVVHGFDIAVGRDETVLVIHGVRGGKTAALEAAIEQFKQDNPTARVVMLGVND